MLAGACRLVPLSLSLSRARALSLSVSLFLSRSRSRVRAFSCYLSRSLSLTLSVSHTIALLIPYRHTKRSYHQAKRVLCPMKLNVNLKAEAL